MLSPRSMSRRARAFTLIELLVSMTVLVILVGLIGQMVNSATSVTVGNRERLDADGQARVVFDRMAYDFGKMLKRSDVDYVFAKIDGTNGGANDKMFFYSEAPGFFDNPSAPTTARSSVALVGYRINPLFQLERLGKQLTWDGATANATPGGIMFLCPSPTPTGGGTSSSTSMGPDLSSTLSGNWPKTLGSSTDSPPYSPDSSNPTDADYHVLASQVCRLEFCFQLTNGKYSAVPVSPLTDPVTLAPTVTNNLTATLPPKGSDSGPTYAAGSRWYDTTTGRAYVCVDPTVGNANWTFLGMQDVRAVVVALAILDSTSTKTAPTVSVTYNNQTYQDIPDLSNLITMLSDSTIKDTTTGSGNTSSNTVPNLVLTPTPRLMADAWKNTLTADLAPGTTSKSGLSKRAEQQVRIYQRAFVFNNQ